MPATFDVERFEHVAATADTALLRLSGRWRAEQRERLSPPMLVVDDGRRTHRLAALPGPEDAAPLAGPVARGGRRPPAPPPRRAARPGGRGAARRARFPGLARGVQRPGRAHRGARDGLRPRRRPRRARRPPPPRRRPPRAPPAGR